MLKKSGICFVLIFFSGSREKDNLLLPPASCLQKLNDRSLMDLTLPNSLESNVFVHLRQIIFPRYHTIL